MCPHVVQDVSCFLEALQTRPDIFNMSYGQARSEICLGWNRGCNRGLKCSDLCTFALQSTNHKVSWDQLLLHTKQNYFTMSPQMSYYIENFCSCEYVTTNLMFIWFSCLLPVESLRWWRAHMPLKHVHTSRPLWGCGGIEHWGFRNPTRGNQRDLSVYKYWQR